MAQFIYAVFDVDYGPEVVISYHSSEELALAKIEALLAEDSKDTSSHPNEYYINPILLEN